MELLGRSWTYLDDNGMPKTVVPKFMPGVIGMQPLLKPGQSFQYMSSVAIPSVEGKMEGVFLMRDCDTKDNYEVQIATCALKPSNVFVSHSHL